MKRIAYIALSLIMLLCIGYMVGPKAPVPNLDPNPISCSISIDSLSDWIALKESGFKTLKPGNGAELVWQNDSIAKTEYAVVYLHGFTATQEEGNPVHRSFAKRYRCNLYLARLYGHGLDTADAMIDITPENYLESAKEAIAIGKQIGEKVIVMCTSTGGTLGLYLAAHDPEIAALICYSPNIDIYDPNSKMLTKPWGLQLVRLVMGSEYRQYEAPEEFKKYWQTKYRIEGLMTVRSLIDHTMTEKTFSQIKQPVFVGGYYKDEEHQDKVVSVAAMRKMMPLLGTSKEQKVMVEFPEVGAHVMASPIRSKDVESVFEETFKFAEEVVGLKRID